MSGDEVVQVTAGVEEAQVRDDSDDTGQYVAESDVDAHPLVGGRVSRHHDTRGQSVAEGPPIFAEPSDLWRWCTLFCDVLNSHSVNGVTLKQRLFNVFKTRNVALITDNSGMGCPEVSLSTIGCVVRRDQFPAAHPIDSEESGYGNGGGNADVGKVICVRAGDVLPECREALKHLGIAAPKCIFGDAMSRVPHKVRQMADEIWAELEDKIPLVNKDGADHGGQNRKASRQAKAAGMKAFHKLVRAYIGARQQRLWPLHAECCIHQTMCPVQPVLADDQLSSITICSIGFLCYAWSSMGTQDQAASRAGSEIIALWIRERLAHQEHLLIGECTQHFQAEPLNKYLSNLYELYEFVLCPSMFGLPKCRVRRYMIWAHKAKLQLIEGLDSKNIVELFKVLFFRPIASTLKPSMYFRSPKTMVDEYVETYAITRGFPRVEPNGSPWSMFQILQGGHRRRLLQHENLVRQEGADIESTSEEFILGTGILIWPRERFILF